MQMFFKPLFLPAYEYDAEVGSVWNQAISHFVPVHRRDTRDINCCVAHYLNIFPIIYRVLTVGKESSLEFTMRLW